LKILYIAPLSPPVTGQSVAVDALFSALVESRHEVTSINLSKNSFRQGISSLGRVFEILRLTWRTWRSGRDFDLVYLTTSESLAGNLKDLLLLAVLGKLRSSTWLHLHGGAGMRVLLANRKGWLARLNGYFLKQVAGVIVLGERLAPIFYGYQPPEQIRIVKNFAADELFLSKDEIARKWTDNKTLRVLFLSNLLPGKGHAELLNAIRNLPIEYTKRFKFDFAGGFESDIDREVFLASIASHPSVSYHGIVHGDVKKALLAQAHVFCLPTFYPYEGQPISILEAYASGCAVLTTNHSGIFDIFTPGKNGLEVRPRESDSILVALLALAAHPPQGAAFALQNLNDAISLYTKRAHLQQMYKVLGLGG
jgi:glycosyltransferase involved in cell wall biosynthesis